MSGIPQLTKVDQDLGAVRFCARCNDWLPDDNEFWLTDVRPAGSRVHVGGRLYVRPSATVLRRCRACRAEDARAYRLRFVEKNVSNISTTSVDTRTEIGGQPAPNRPEQWTHRGSAPSTLAGSTPLFGGVS